VGRCIRTIVFEGSAGRALGTSGDTDEPVAIEGALTISTGRARSTWIRAHRAAVSFARAQRVACTRKSIFVLIDGFSITVGDRAGVAVFEPVNTESTTGTRVAKRHYRQRGCARLKSGGEDRIVVLHAAVVVRQVHEQRARIGERERLRRVEGRKRRVRCTRVLAPNSSANVVGAIATKGDGCHLEDSL